jgi:arsenate reductase
MQKSVKQTVLFVCTHNSARSQMAEGLLNSLYGTKYQAYSAGTEPSAVNPFAIQVMSEIHVDISKKRSKSINEFMEHKFDYVITVCDHVNETCPFFPGGIKRLHRSFEDPASYKGSSPDTLLEFRRIRDKIKEWIAEEFKITA